MAKVKRRTIGTNPLDAVVPEPQAVPQPRTPAPAAPVSKERLTVHLPVELIDGVKNAVYWTPGLTLARLADCSPENIRGDHVHGLPGGIRRKKILRTFSRILLPSKLPFIELATRAPRRRAVQNLFFIFEAVTLFHSSSHV